jgi:hypothetical protein
MAELTEEWRHIIDGYFVSTLGRVKSPDTKFKKSRILKLIANNEGYLNVGIGLGENHATHRVNRLVAIAFIPNPGNKPEVGHIGVDSEGRIDKSDNRACSLVWMTGEENRTHAIESGLHGVGEQNATAKLTDASVRIIKGLIAAGEHIPDIAREFGVHRGAIYQIQKGRTWQHIEWPQ